MSRTAGIISSIKSMLLPKVVQHSLPGGMFEFLKRYGKEPDVSRAALVKKYWGWVYSCVQLGAAKVASTPLRVYASRGRGETSVKNFPCKKVGKYKTKYLKKRFKSLANVGGAEDFEELEEHPLIDLLQKVNEQENSFELKELTSIMLDLTGDAYWFVESDKFGIPNKIFLLRSQFTRIVPDQDKFIDHYLYGEEGVMEKLKIDAKDVIHFKYPNPYDPWYGLGPVQAAAYTVEEQYQREMFMIATMSNMARPDLVVKYVEGELDTKERQMLEREWNQLFRGTNKAGKVKVTDYRYELEKIGWSPRELTFHEGEEWIMKKICSAFPVPVGLIDTTQISKAPRSGMEGSDLFMAQFNTLPRLTRIEEKLNEQLCPRYDERLFVAFDNPVPRDDIKQLNEDNTRLNNYTLTINEVREREGEEPVPWGDVPLTQPGIAPLGSSQEPVSDAGEDTLSPNGSGLESISGSDDLPGGAEFEEFEEVEGNKSLIKSGKGMIVEVDGQYIHSTLAGIPLRLKPTRNEYGRFDVLGQDNLRAGGDDIESLRRVLDLKKLSKKYIKKENDEFCVYSHQTGKKMGCYPTKEEAEKRLEQISRFSKEGKDD